MYIGVMYSIRKVIKIQLTDGYNMLLLNTSHSVLFAGCIGTRFIYEIDTWYGHYYTCFSVHFFMNVVSPVKTGTLMIKQTNIDF